MRSNQCVLALALMTMAGPAMAQESYPLSDTKLTMKSLGLTPQAQARLAEQIRKAEGMEIISERPAGKVINMSREAVMQTKVHTPDGDVPETHYLANIISEVVEGDDGYIYIKNPATYYRTGTYIRAERGEGDEVIVHTPQPVISQNGSTFYLGKITIRDVASYGDPQFYYPSDEEGFDIVFDYKDGVLTERRQLTQTFDATGQTTQTETSPILALVSQNYIDRQTVDSYTGYGDYNLVLTPVTEEPAVLPEEAVVEDFQIDYTYMGQGAKGFVKCAIVGDEVYLNAFSDYMPDAWARGVISGKTVSFSGPQYLGGYTAATTRPEYAHIYFLPCKAEDSEDGKELVYTPMDELVFQYDPESKTMYTTDNFAINVGKTEMNEFVVYGMPVLSPYVEMMTELRDPEIEVGDTGYDLFVDDHGKSLSSFTCKLSDQDTEGYLLNWNSLSYTIYKDERPVEISRSEFPAMPDEYVGGTRFPFLAMEDEAIYFDTQIMAYYFYDRPKQVSVQLFYVDADGVEHQSKRTGYDFVKKKVLTDMGDPVIPTGISTLTASGPTTSVIYDAAGRQFNTPQKGLNIVRTEGGKMRKVVK